MGGRKAREGGDVCFHIADSHCCTAETNIIKQIYSNLKKNFFLSNKGIDDWGGRKCVGNVIVSNTECQNKDVKIKGQGVLNCDCFWRGRRQLHISWYRVVCMAG